MGDQRVTTHWLYVEANRSARDNLRVLLSSNSAPDSRGRLWERHHGRAKFSSNPFCRVMEGAQCIQKDNSGTND
jgi:hypothetical protein